MSVLGGVCACVLSRATLLCVLTSTKLRICDDITKPRLSPPLPSAVPPHLLVPVPVHVVQCPTKRNSCFHLSAHRHARCIVGTDREQGSRRKPHVEYPTREVVLLLTWAGCARKHNSQQRSTHGVVAPRTSRTMGVRSSVFGSLVSHRGRCAHMNSREEECWARMWGRHQRFNSVSLLDAAEAGDRPSSAREVSTQRKYEDVLLVSHDPLSLSNTT